MKIIDEINLIKRLIDAANNSPHEECFFAFAKLKNSNITVLDMLSLEEFGVKNKKYESFIPQETTFAFLKLCIRLKMIPVIAHTHPRLSEPVSFSTEDIKFEESFCQAMSAKGYASSLCVFLVTDGKTVAQRVLKKDNVMKIKEIVYANASSK